MKIFVLYVWGFITAWLITALTLPLLRRFIGPRLADTPGGLKQHTGVVPTVGGCGILLGTLSSLILIRLCTNFPSGTLHNLRGILLGSMLIFTMGLVDDFTKPRGLPIWLKLVIQAAATACLIHYGVVIQAIQNAWISWPLTFLWVVGLTNAFNLLDIQNGLCVTQAIVCTAGLTLITLPHEYIYVNFAALAVLGACLAFWPHNHAKKHPIFLGDSGSNLLGFLIAALSIGYGYSAYSNWGFLAPLFILLVPLFDTTFVSIARMLKGKNPLRGSNDHAALRLQAVGWKNKHILLAFSVAGLLGNLAAFWLTRGGTKTAISVFCLTLAVTFAATAYLLKKEPRV